MKLKNFLLFFFAAWLIIANTQLLNAQNERAKYIGYKYKGVVPNTILSNGVKLLGGGLIGDFDTDPVYGISQVKKGKTTMLWLEVSTGKDESGVTGWLVKDVLVFPPMTKNQHLFFSAADPAVYCQRNKKDVENLIAVGLIQRSRGIFKPNRAWIVNLKANRFDEVSVKGLRCEYSEP